MEQSSLRDRLRHADAALATAYTLTQAFTTMVRERQGERPDTWIAAASASAIPDLRRFAIGLLADKATTTQG